MIGSRFADVADGAPIRVTRPLVRRISSRGSIILLAEEAATVVSVVSPPEGGSLTGLSGMRASCATVDGKRSLTIVLARAANLF